MTLNRQTTPKIGPSAQLGLVLTAVGPDRPGLVKELAADIRERGGNVEETRMSKLGGEFAMLMLITGSDKVLAALETFLSSPSVSADVSCFVRRTTKTADAEVGRPLHLEASGFDRPGILENLTRVLVGRSVNVLSLKSHIGSAAQTGTPIFYVSAELRLPTTMSLAALQTDLDAICEEEDLDYSLTASRTKIESA